jgi:hypothetical protein
VTLQERLLGLLAERHHERGAGEAGAHREQMHHRLLAAQQNGRLPPIDLRLDTRIRDQRHEHLADLPELAALVMHVAVDLPLRHDSAVLLHQPLPDPPGRMALLPRRVPVSLQPAIDDRPIRPELRRRPRPRRPLGRRDRRLQRLTNRPAMHPMTLRQLPDREPLARVIAPDLLELLHSSPCSFRTFRSRLTKREPKSSARTEVGPVQTSTVGPVQTSTLNERVGRLELADSWPVSPHLQRTRRDLDPLVWSIWANPPVLRPEGFDWNSRLFHVAQIPAAGAIGTARSIAALYGKLDRVLKPGTVAWGSTTMLSEGWDAIVQQPQRFGVGFMLANGTGWCGPEQVAFGHTGAGGSVHGCWPRWNLGFSYVMNLLKDDERDDPRGAALLGALHRCLAGHSAC